jgi:hypothetical protein
VVRGDVGKSQSRVSRPGNTSMRDPELTRPVSGEAILRPGRLGAVWADDSSATDTRLITARRIRAFGPRSHVRSLLSRLKLGIRIFRIRRFPDRGSP